MNIAKKISNLGTSTKLLVGIIGWALIMSSCVSVASTLTGCSPALEPPAIVSEPEMAATAQNDSIVSTTGALRNIAGTNLTYDENTRIVYYKFKDSIGYNGYGFMSPYYGPHDNLCRYENGQVVEMNGGSNVETTGE